MTLVWRPGFQFDADASTYIEAVEAADTQALETGVRYAINDFVIGCKNDGIWDAIKASCILAGARTLNGALVPLVGAAPTNYNFGAGDYSRKLGLIGDGSTKYLDSNRAGNADPQDNNHTACYQISVQNASNKPYMNAGSFFVGARGLAQYNQKPEFFATSISVGGASGLVPANSNVTLSSVFAGSSRSASNLVTARYNSQNYTFTRNSATPTTASIWLYRWNGAGSPAFSDARLAFYSIGESLDLAKLDTRVSALITAIGAAIP